MKTKYSIEIIDLRHQLELIPPRKIQLIQDYDTNTDNARLFFNINYTKGN